MKGNVSEQIEWGLVVYSQPRTYVIEFDKSLWHFGGKHRRLGRFLPTQPTNKSFAVNKLQVECHLHTVEVVGSNPAVPTI